MRLGARGAWKLTLAIGIASVAACGGSGGSGGSSAPAGRTLTPTDPETDGPLAFTSSTLTFDGEGFGTYSATAFVPAPDGQNEPWPSVVLLNGLSATAPMMTWLSDHLASHGYVVLAVTPPNPFSLDVTQWARGFIDGASTLESESARSGSPLAGQVDSARLGAIGLSMGGAGALEAAGTDPRFAAVVSLAPGWSDYAKFLFQDTLAAAGKITTPTQIQRGSEDCLVPADGPLGYYAAVPARKQYLEIHGGDHIGYINDGLATVAGPIVFDAVPIDCPTTVPYEEQHRLGGKYATMWFDTYLYGSDHWSDALYGSGFAADLASGALSQGMTSAPQP